MPFTKNCIVDSTTPGSLLCRCCLLRPPDKDLTATYYLNGKDEIYGDMLQECFAIDLTMDKEDYHYHGICDDCIMHLRNALQFKQQVQKCQQDLQTRFATELDNLDKFIKIKVEIPDSDDDLMTMEDKHYLNMTSSNDVITEPCSSKKHLRETNEAQVTTDNSKAYLSERISVRNQKKKSTGIGKKKMQVHKNTLDNNEIFDRMNKKLICDDCGYIFLTKSSIIKHISSAHQSSNRISKTVQDIKPLVCTTCNKKFSHKHTLERHILTHTKNPNYKFIVNYGAKTEVQRKWKSDSKKYKCKYCDYSRDVKNPVTIHERKHTGEKPFQCSFCDYRSAQKSHITVHERIHTGEKPFACEFCDYKCVNRQGLKYHERRHR